MANPIVTFFKEIIYNGLEHFGRYYSSYRGIVYRNDDPLKLGRVQLAIPQLTGNDIYEYWAYPKNQFNGKGYGSRITPQVQEMVWVEFENGHPETPIFSLGHFGVNEIDDDELNDPNCYWFKSPQGHLVKINDTKNTIIIQSKSGDTIEIDSEGISLITLHQISLGTLDKSKYHGVLGEELLAALRKNSDILQSLTTALSNDIKTSTNLGSPFLAFTALNSAMSQMKSNSDFVKSQIEKILSDKVTLDK